MTSEVFNLREYRKTLGWFATGVTVITTLADGETHGITANAFVAVSFDPQLGLVPLDNRSKIHCILSNASLYGLSVLGEDQRLLSEHFAGRAADAAQIGFVNRAGTPLVSGAVAFFVVRVVDVHLAGDHTLYIRTVEHFESRDDKPLLFYSGSYRHIRAEIASI
jgi:flavin reductase (DIM6/NTAB) family NADH-FMN oxidoreductase RutF